MNPASSLAVVKFTSYRESVSQAMDAIDAGAALGRQKAVLVKPNIVESLSPPITTPIACVEAVIEYIRRHSKAEIVIAEGCGAPNYETDHAFSEQGYRELAARLNVSLVDLNRAPTVLLKKAGCKIFPQFHMPEIAMSHFILSVPVLKAHSLAKITGSLKSMMGFAPPEHYRAGGHWKKSAFHARMHESIVELNRYRTPDLTLLDATIGLAEFHLGGPHCDPPVNKIVAGFDPLEVDRTAAGLLGFDWRKIPHLAG